MKRIKATKIVIFRIVYRQLSADINMKNIRLIPVLLAPSGRKHSNNNTAIMRKDGKKKFIKNLKKRYYKYLTNSTLLAAHRKKIL